MACSPSDMANSDASMPVMRSSMTIDAPAWPNCASSSMLVIAAIASSLVSATTTPLPAANPSALMTWPSAACPRIKSQASVLLSNRCHAGCGISCRSQKSRANAFDPSSMAACWLGPKTRIPRRRSRSASPSTNGASGPITTRSMAAFSIRSNNAGSSAQVIHVASFAMPGLPGLTISLFSRGDLVIAWARACSLPPPPMISTFI